MKIRYNLTTEDLVELQQNHLRTSKGYKKSLKIVGIVIIIFFVASGFFGLLGIEDFSFSTLMVDIVIPIIVSLFIIFLIYLFGEKINAYFYRIMFKIGDNSAYLGLNEIKLNEKYLIEKAPGIESKILWEKIVEYTEADKYLFIRISDVQGLIIPKFKAKSSTGLNKALTFIRTKLNDKKFSNKDYKVKSENSGVANSEKKGRCINVIKKILMWFSGFVLFLYTLLVLISMTQPNPSNDKLTNIIIVITFSLAIIYIWWEIIDSLRSR